MDNLSVTSVMDLQLTSDDEEYDDEIMMMAQCVEMELSAPIPVPGPSSSRLDCVIMQGNLARNKTFDQKHSTPPVFDQSFFSLGRGNGPIRRDDRVRNNHPIKLCSKLTPLVDTPMSPPTRREGAGLQSSFKSISWFRPATDLGYDHEPLPRYGA